DKIVLWLLFARANGWPHIVQVETQLAAYGDEGSNQLFRMPARQVGRSREREKGIKALMHPGIATICQPDNLSSHTHSQLETDLAQISPLLAFQARNKFISQFLH